jgi:serine/threonine-protein kinase
MPEPASDPFQLCGTTIEGKYSVASVVGDGGFGVVYRGVHKGFGEPIAVKCLKLPLVLDDAQREGLLEQLREEGRLLHRLSKATSGIVQALDVGAFTTPAGIWVPYLVLEWLEGETLAEHLKKRAARGLGPYSLAEAVKLLEPAARALAVAHQQKIAHRDVKPPNLFVTTSAGQQTVKVLDFGIAKVLTDYPTFTEALAATKLGPTAFTPRYGAPEQFNRQRGATGPWTDVFALALILVEMVTGRKALDGDDPTQLYIASADPMARPTPRARGAEVSDAVERVLDKALNVEPKHRYVDAGEFWDALAAAASLPPRASGPHDSSPRGVPISSQSSVGSLTADRVMLNTADFLDHSKSNVQPAEASKDPRRASPGAPGAILPLDATMLADSTASDPSNKPIIVVNTPLPQSREAPSAAAAKKPAAMDPMAETPPRARNPPGVAEKPLGAPGDARPEPPPPPAKARAFRPWMAVAVGLLGAVAGVIVLQDRGTGDKRTGASASATGLAARRPAVSPKVQATTDVDPASSASASASAAIDSEPPPNDMVLIPAGTFLMGDPRTPRKITITRRFYIDRLEVTTRAYEECVAQRKCSAADHVSVTPEGPADAGAPGPPSDFVATWTPRCNANRKALDHPINCVDFSNAESYCRFRGRRLPTEAEWELTARGAEARAFSWGLDVPDCNRACYDRNGACRRATDVVATCSAGLHTADRTPEGVFDLGGNVAEWVSDGYSARPAGSEDPKGDPAAPLRVVRGGSFLDQVDMLSATWRTAVAPVTAHVSIGFRCAKDGPAAER